LNMNLVQINERLKDLPMQVIQQYANGMNPEVPPYLALGELQRRELSQKQMATAQGAQQGPQPSVKEQVEQKAGLMALQQMQQQQMAQQQAQPRGPMPAPAGVPQPERQPQTPQPQAMMARGGLAGIPVRRDMFEYAGGGIIAFQSGGQPKKYETRYDRLTRKNRGELTEEEKQELARYEAMLAQIPTGGDPTVTGGERASGSELGRNVQNTAMALPGASAARALSGGAGSARGMMAALAALTGRETPEDQAAPAAVQKPTTAPAPVEQAMLRQMDNRMMPASPAAASRPPSVPMPSAPSRSGPPAAAMPTPPMSQGTPSAPMPQAGLPAALAGNPEFSAAPISPRIAQVDEMMTSQKRTAPTAEQIKSDVSALMPAGMQEEAMQKRFAEQRARADARERGYKESQPSGLDNLIRVLGQAGQYKGFSGIGPAYTSMQQQRRAEDLAFQKQQDDLMTAIEGREYGADKDVFSSRSTAMDRAQQSFSENQKSILAAAAKMAETEQGRLSEDNKAKMALDLKRFELLQKQIEGDKDRASQESRVKWQVANQNIIEKQGVEYVNILAQARAERAKGTPQSIAKADALEARAKSIETVIGKGGYGGGGAGAGPKPMTRDQASDNVAKKLEITNPNRKQIVADATQALRAAGIQNPSFSQIEEHLIQEQMKGVDLSTPSGTNAPVAGKVPPPPPGFKLN
jgi:hypothetical protein